MRDDHVLVNSYIVDTDIAVSFRLGRKEYVHYLFAKGRITEEEATTALESSVNPYTLKRMEQLVSHLGYDLGKRIANPPPAAERSD